MIANKNVKDGEIFLYRYKLTSEEDSPIFTSVAAIYVDENSTDDANHTPRIEVLGNYTELSDAINAVDTKVGAVDTKVNTLDDTINGKEGTKGLTTRMTEAEGKILANERAIGTITNTVSPLSGKITAVESRMDTAEGRMDTAEDAITAVESRMDTAEDAITAVEGRMTTAEGAITVVEGRMTIAEGAITGLQNSISGMSLTASDVVTMNEASTALQASKISETNGIVTVETAETIVEFNQAIGSDNKVATMVDITDAAYTAGKGITITDKVIAANLTLSYDENTKKITLVDANGGEFGFVDATDFIKDGMLKEAKLVEKDGEGNTGKFLKLTWNTDADPNADGTTGDVVYINVTEFIDTYTADETYLTVANNQFSHKTQEGIVIPEGMNTLDKGITADVTVNSTAEQSFKVPSLKVDAAGHVVSVDEKTVTIKLPGFIDTAVQTVTSTEAVNTTDKFVAVKANRTGNDVVLTNEVKTQAIATATANLNGLAVASDVKSYVDNAIANTPKVNTVTELTAGSGITVTDGATDGNHNYTVGLKIDSTSMLSIKGDGALTISNVVDCGKYAE